MNEALKFFSDEDLKRELMRREVDSVSAHEFHPILPADRTIGEGETFIMNIHQMFRNDKEQRRYLDDDTKHYVYEATMTHVYGKNWNTKLKNYFGGCLG
jgi:hypothetical protein